MCPTRAKVDEVYRNLHCLCDVLDGKTKESHDSNPHGLLVSESNELLGGLKKLFTKSDDKEQVRLMTIAPHEWGRQKNRKMIRNSFFTIRSLSSIFTNDWSLDFFAFGRFNSKESQARRSLVQRRNQGTLAYPQCLRGNVPLSDETIDTVVKFYCEDGISRTSSHSKDTIKINGQLVVVRFMEMTVLDAY